jgi:asparagine synthase (glutamine-hydrolysing)
VREPFLDHNLAEWAAKLPLAWRIGSPKTGYASKRVLREFCARRLPRGILERPKQGFPVPAYGWLAGDLGSWAKDLLFAPGSRIGSLLRMDQVRPVLERARRGDHTAAHKVWSLMVLEQWLQAWI